MLKFTINLRQLKETIDKVTTCIDKKLCIPDLKRIYFQIDENGVLKIWATNMDHWVEVRNNKVYAANPGIVGIDIDDIKIITKMSGEIIIEDATTEGKINITCGKKVVSIPGYQNTDIFLPTMDESKTKVLGIKENWLLDTVSSLSAYTKNYDSSNNLLSTFHFNTKDNRVEATDCCRIGMRSLKNQKIYNKTENRFDMIKLHNRCVNVFKKLLDKKSESEVVISQDKKYIRLEGKDFTYITRRVDGEYYDISKILNFDYEYKFVPNKEDIIEAMNYDADLVKSKELPVIFHGENGNLYSYIRTEKYESFDEIGVSENNMKDEFYIAFNPRFLADAFGVVDSNNPVCIGTNALSPLIITGEEYSFLILPVNAEVIEYNYKEKIEYYINKNRAA